MLMNIYDASLWPSDVGPIRFERASGEFARPGELTLTGADGTELASLAPLAPNEYLVALNDGRGTLLPLPPAAWEVTVYDGSDNGSVAEIYALAPTNGTIEAVGAPASPALRTWAVLAVLCARWPSTCGHG